MSGYEIASVENITLTVPSSCVRTNRTTNSTNFFLVMPTPGNCTLGGTLLSGNEEGSIRTSPSTLDLRLVADKWRRGETPGPTGMEDAIARSIIGAVESDQSEVGGWQQIVHADLMSGGLIGRIQLLTDDIVRISLPPYPDYEISEPETLSVRLPGEALQSRAPLAVAVTATPSLLIRPSPAVAAVVVKLTTGAHVPSISEGDLRAGCELHLIVIGDCWSPDVVGGDTLAAAALLGALRSQQEDEEGAVGSVNWNALVRPSLHWHNLSQPFDYDNIAQNGTRLVVALPPLPSYDILAPETIAIAVPSSALKSGRVAYVPPLLVHAQPGTLAITGSLSSSTIRDVDVRSGGIFTNAATARGPLGAS